MLSFLAWVFRMAYTPQQQAFRQGMADASKGRVSAYSIYKAAGQDELAHAYSSGYAHIVKQREKRR